MKWFIKEYRPFLIWLAVGMVFLACEVVCIVGLLSIK